MFIVKNLLLAGLSNQQKYYKLCLIESTFFAHSYRKYKK